MGGADRAAQGPPAKRRAVLPLLVMGAAVVLGGLLQLPALGYGPVWDDVSQVVPPYARLGCDAPLDCFSQPRQKYYRPVFTASLASAIARYGPDEAAVVRGLHAENLLLSLALTAAVAWLLSRALGRPAAALGALAFALHPVRVSTTTWITGRADTLPVLLAVLAFGLVLAGDRPGRRLLWGLALLCFAGAVFAKEQVAVLALVVPFLPRSWRARLGLGLAFLAVGVAWVLVARALVPLQLVYEAPWSAPRHAALVLRTLGAYGQLLALPDAGVLHEVTLGPWDELRLDRVAIGLLVAVGAPLAAWRLRQHHRGLALLIFAGLACLAPVANVVPVPAAAVGAYRALVPAIALAAAFGVFAERALHRRRALQATAAALWLGWCGVQTVADVPRWRSDDELFLAIHEADPHYALAPHYLGDSLLARGAHAPAEALYDEALRLYTGDADAVAVVRASAEPGLVTRMQEHSLFDVTKGWREELARLLFARAFAREQLGRGDLAIGDLRAGLFFQPTADEPAERLARLLLASGRAAEAREVLEPLVARAPTPARQELLERARAGP